MSSHSSKSLKSEVKSLKSLLKQLSKDMQSISSKQLENEAKTNELTKGKDEKSPILKKLPSHASISKDDEAMAFVSQVEPKNLNEALKDSNWILAMQEELNQFALNEVWTLVPRIPEMNVIGTKWVFRNKMDEHGVITRNKARLVAKGYNQEEGIDYDETYAPVARLEAVRLLLAFSCIKGFKLFQM